MLLRLRKQPENDKNLLDHYKAKYIYFHLGSLIILPLRPMRAINLFKEFLTVKIMHLLLLKSKHFQVYQISLHMKFLLLFLILPHGARKTGFLIIMILFVSIKALFQKQKFFTVLVLLLRKSYEYCTHLITVPGRCMEGVITSLLPTDCAAMTQLHGCSCKIREVLFTDDFRVLHDAEVRTQIFQSFLRT